jgi:predicted nucleotidyltransferase
VPSRLELLLAKDAQDRTARARQFAEVAVQRLEELGVEARIVGSLARGDFRGHSDIDILVLRCPPDRRYRIEGAVEEAAEGFPFDVIYLDEVPAPRRARLLGEARLASDLP